jgi:hypothetical protein
MHNDNWEMLEVKKEIICMKLNLDVAKSGACL